MTKTVRVSSKRQIAIPKKLCASLGIHIGQHLLLEASHGRLILSPKPRSYSNALEGLGRDIWKGVDPLAYIRRERSSWKKHRSLRP